MTTQFSTLAYKDYKDLDMDLSSWSIVKTWVVKNINKSWVSGPGRNPQGINCYIICCISNLHAWDFEKTKYKLFQLTDSGCTFRKSEWKKPSFQCHTSKACILRGQIRQLCIIFLKGSWQIIKSANIYTLTIATRYCQSLTIPLIVPRWQNIPRSNWKQGDWKDGEIVHWHWHSKTTDLKLSLLFPQAGWKDPKIGDCFFP